MLIFIDFCLGMNFPCQGNVSKGLTLTEYEGAKCSCVRLMCVRTEDGEPEQMRKTGKIPKDFGTDYLETMP